MNIAYGMTLVLAAAALIGCGSSRLAVSQPLESDERDHIWATLDALHDNASKARFDAYFDLYTPDAVFLGTDATERWPLDDFKAYAKPHFDKGTGWTYTLIGARRYITISPGGDVAWFDEALHNATLGECRGSGVLVRTSRGWKIAQYNLTMPVPNDMIEDVAREIQN